MHGNGSRRSARGHAFERGVSPPAPERIRRGDLLGVVPAEPDVRVLCKTRVPVLTGEIAGSRGNYKA